MAIPGIERLRRAGDGLRRDGDGEVMPLLGAATDVWAAMFDMESWPADLRTEAVALQTSLFRYGPIRTTVEQMVVPERLQLRREMLDLVDLAERFDGADPDRSRR